MIRNIEGVVPPCVCRCATRLQGTKCIHSACPFLGTSSTSSSSGGESNTVG